MMESPLHKAAAAPTARRWTSPDVRVEWLSSLAAARALEPEWRALIEGAVGVTPFQNPAWLLEWYSVWAAERIRVLTARRGRELVALLPCVAADGRVELAGSGVSDYLAPIVLPAVTDDVMSALDAALGATGLPIAFHDVPRDSPWIAAVSEHPKWNVSGASVCPVVGLPREVDAWRRALPSGLQRNVRRYSRQIADRGDAAFATVGEQGLDRALDALIRLHTRRWHEHHRPGVFTGEEVRQFHRATARALIRDGTLRLHVLTAAREIVGVQYVLVRPPRAYSYIGGFDPDWGKYSPGTLLMAYAIERAIEDGCTEFDLLRGAEAYKYAWGAADERSATLLRDVGP